MNIQTLIWNTELACDHAKSAFCNGKIGDAAEFLAQNSVLIQDHLKGTDIPTNEVPDDGSPPLALPEK